MNTNLFSELNLAEPIARAVAGENYTQPTPIQMQAIPHLLEGRDLLGCAQTGTGKTAAFALPILHQLEMARRPAKPCMPHVLVLSPTRELAAQIGDSFKTYGQFVRFRHTVIFGGVNQGPQVRALERGVHVVIATPGRLLDLMEQGYVGLKELKTFVLDEADRMLDMGFLPDLRRIISKLPEQRQSLFFSATLPPHVADLAHGLLRDPVKVEVSPDSTTCDNVEQRVMHVSQSNKTTLLKHLLDERKCGRTLIFTRTKRGADRLCEQLDKMGLQSDSIHGNKSQNARTRVLKDFRTGRVQVLVATDVAARGIDVDDITHVFNYDMPEEPEAYVHRIGRTARAGANGTAFSFCDASERWCLAAIEKLTKSKIQVDAKHPFHIDVSSERTRFGGSDAGRSRRKPAGKFRSSSRRDSSEGRGDFRSGDVRGGGDGAKKSRFGKPRSQSQFGKKPARKGSRRPAAKV